MKYSVGIVDDNEHIARQIAEKLLLTDCVDVLFIANGGAEAIDWMKSNKVHPQIVLMDIEMPVMTGVEATFRLSGLYPSVCILMLTVFDNEANIFNAIRAGASGYLLKDETIPRMMDAFRDVVEGGVPMSPAIARRSMEMMLNGYKPGKQIMYRDDQEELSKREVEILELMASGKTLACTAAALYISPHTVKKHVEHIYNKLHVRSRVEMLLWYQQQ